MSAGRHAVLAPYFQRGLALWCGVRALISAFLLLAGDDPLRISLAAALLIVAVAVMAGVAETSRRGEWALLGNLMVRPSVLAGTFAAAAIVGEVVLRGVGIVLR